MADLRFTPAEAAALLQHAASANRTGAVARAREPNLIPEDWPRGKTCRLPRFPGMRLSFSQMPYLA